MALTLATAALLLLTAHAAALGPQNGADCGSGVTCFPCLAAQATPELEPEALACGNATQRHAGVCLHDRAHILKKLNGVASADACCAACADAATCAAFTFFNRSSCNLFTDVGDAQNLPSCESGYPPGSGPAPAPPPPPPPQPVPPPGPACTTCPNIILMFTDDQDLTIGR